MINEIIINKNLFVEKLHCKFLNARQIKLAGCIRMTRFFINIERKLFFDIIYSKFLL